MEVYLPLLVAEWGSVHTAVGEITCLLSADLTALFDSGNAHKKMSKWKVKEQEWFGSRGQNVP